MQKTEFDKRTTTSYLKRRHECPRYPGSWGGSHSMKSRWFHDGLRCQFCFKTEERLDQEFADYMAVNTPELRRAKAISEGMSLHSCEHCNQECALDNLGWNYVHVSWTEYATYACRTAQRDTKATPVGVNHTPFYAA